MKKLFIGLMGSLFLLSISNAQVETVITTKTAPSGEEMIIGIEYRKTERNFTFDPFEQADKNSDGCLDKNEATDMGILNFPKYAKSSSSCLNPEEYNKAMRGE